MTSLADERMSAIHLLRAGQTVSAVAQQLGRCERWVRKWWQRYQTAAWAGLAEQSRAPHRVPRQLSAEVRQQIILARSALEAQAATGAGLKYIGAPAVRTRLKAQDCQPLPSIASIERALQAAGMTRPRRPAVHAEVVYPHLQPTAPQQLCQVDIVPHYLTGGTRVPCFNAIDAVSRCATGMAYEERRAQEACAFAVQVWQTLGIPCYTQFDNDSCFDGGHTHPHVLGQLVRLALAVGTEALFSPVRHPESNGYVERFHQEYNRHVWDDTYLADLAAVQRESEHFFSLYCASGHHAALHGRTPQEVHGQPTYRLPADFTLPTPRWPLYEGRVHFIRQVLADNTVSVLNVRWAVPNPEPLKGVWVTIELRTAGATLTIYDAAPDVRTRRCLATYPFPVKEPILPRTETTIGRPGPVAPLAPLALAPATAVQPPGPIALLLYALLGAVRWTRKTAFGTMF
jgi:transposase InsO family protein/transposase-like protein